MTPKKPSGDGIVQISDFGERYLGVLDKFIKPLIWYSVILTIVEILIGGKDSFSGDYHFVFLWSERIVALLFTIELVLRLIRSGPGKYVFLNKAFPYVHVSPFAWIDIVSVVPFWLGFFLPSNILGYVRMLRVFRLLKFYRYSRSLQLNALAFYRAYLQLKSLAFQVFITSLFFALMVFQAEVEAQPEAFGNLGLAGWFTVVTATTVGFGDRSPITAMGMIVVSIMMPIIIAQMGAVLGVFGNCFQQVIEEELDPNIDPIALFIEERNKQSLMSDLDKEYSMKEDV